MLQVSGSGFRVACFVLRVSGCRVRVASYWFRVAGCGLLVVTGVAGSAFLVLQVCRV